MNSLIIPVYKNEESIVSLLNTLNYINSKISELEVIFVIDGSPDASAELLNSLLPFSGLNATLILLSRNFGSFAAIRAGLAEANGEYFAVMAADQQEPPELIIDFFSILSNENYDVVVATRNSRSDPAFTKISSNLFWKIYSRFIMPEIPMGGVDVFGCNNIFRSELLKLDESHSSLVALLFWMGFKRKIIPYERKVREYGKSAWTFQKKLKYLKDSIFSFTDAPIKLLTTIGIFGIAFSVLMSLIILFGKITGWVNVPGYSATVLTIIFFGALNLLGLGIVGTYAWRAYENTKKRPSSIIMSKTKFPLS